MKERLANNRAALAAATGNRPLRRLLAAEALMDIAGWCGMTALAVYAYDVGGAALVGIAAFVRVIPGLVVGPLLSAVADRGSRRQVLTGTALVRGVLGALGALVVVLQAPAIVVLGLPVLATPLLSAWYPAKAAFVNDLARTPEELTAANVVGSSVASTSIFIGPALGGLLLAQTSVGATLFVSAGLTLLSALTSASIATPAATLAVDEDADQEEPNLLRETLAGFSAVWQDRRLRLLVGLMGLQIAVDGALSVLTVTMAFELLDTGEGGIGALYSALGVGGIVGAVAATALTGSRRLAPPFLVGLVLWGLPLMLIALVADPLFALVMLALLGFGNTLLDVAGYTLLQRVADERMTARVFGVLETLATITGAAGLLLAPLLLAVTTVEGALLATGAFLPVLALLSARGVAAADPPPPHGISLIRSVPMFAPLSARTVERLAEVATRRSVVAGEVVVRQGAAADAFYAIEDGDVVVHEDGVEVRRMREGAFFGEIGLLNATPRTATVTARTGAELLVIGREDFLAALAEAPRATEIGHRISRARLGTARRRVGMVPA